MTPTTRDGSPILLPYMAKFDGQEWPAKKAFLDFYTVDSDEEGAKFRLMVTRKDGEEFSDNDLSNIESFYDYARVAYVHVFDMDQKYLLTRGVTRAELPVRHIPTPVELLGGKLRESVQH